MSNSSQVLSDTPTEKVSVQIKNLPRDIAVSLIEKELKLMVPGCNIRVVTKKNNNSNFKSRGFAFIQFDSQHQAESFQSKDFYYDGQLLSCEIIENDDLYIRENMKSLRNPVKVIVSGKPKHMCANQLESELSCFGEVVEIDFECGESDMKNSAYVTFLNSDDAKSCVQAESKSLKNKTELKFYFARPKFSNYMLKKLNPIMGSYIKKIKHNLMRYYPEDFSKVEQRIQELEKETSAKYSNSQTIEQQIECALKDLKGLKLQSEKTDQGNETNASRQKAEVSYNKSTLDSFNQMNISADIVLQKKQKQATKKHEHQSQNNSFSFNCNQNKQNKTTSPKSNFHSRNLKTFTNSENKDQKLLVKNQNCYNDSLKATYQDPSYYQDQNVNYAQEYYANPSQVSYNPGNYQGQNFEQNYNQQVDQNNQYYNYGPEYYQNNNNYQSFVPSSSQYNADGQQQDLNYYNKPENHQEFYQYEDNANQQYQYGNYQQDASKTDMENCYNNQTNCTQNSTPTYYNFDDFSSYQNNQNLENHQVENYTNDGFYYKM